MRPRAFFLGLLASSMTFGKEPLTPVAALETTRFMVAGTPDGEYISRSPDGKRYVVRLLRGDVAKNRIHLTVMTGSLSSFDAALHPVIASVLASAGRGIPANAGPEGDGIGYASPIRWVDDHRIAFLFSNDVEIRQVVVIDLQTKTTTYWTDHPSQVRAFDIAADGTLVFLAHTRHPSRPSRQVPQDGYVVPTQSDAVSLMQGYFDGSNTFSRAWDSEWFVQRPGSASRQFEVAGRSIDPGLPDTRLISLSPSGRYALIVGPAASVRREWNRFADKNTDEGRLLAAKIAAAMSDPEGLGGRELQQFHLLDVKTTTTRPFMDAPAPLHEVVVDWSADEQPSLREPELTQERRPVSCIKTGP